ncbi:hypothetical protein Glove_155g106 [Diversispora epigaea]|uniref:Uncharacterized protein n=1 Tax=Diversispora epigaea TaxID=1348612 RepID=A0A397IVX9_9GLOM|nr:hypothetical protein Glove_155g106 [Diversispora epigaea]
MSLKCCKALVQVANRTKLTSNNAIEDGDQCLMTFTSFLKFKLEITILPDLNGGALSSSTIYVAIGNVEASFESEKILNNLN